MSGYPRVHELLDPDADWSAPAYLYRCWDDKRGHLLYVGVTVDPYRRMQAHRHQSWWFLDVTRIELTAQPDLDAAFVAELAAIKSERPRWNRSGRPPRSEWTPQMVKDDETGRRMAEWWPTRWDVLAAIEAPTSHRQGGDPPSAALPVRSSA